MVTFLVQNTYDSSSRVISQTNARGYTTTLAYNTPAQGQTTITDPLGHKTVHTYDSSMRITGIADALGHTTSYTYDANNDVASVTDARNNISNFTYDSFGNLLTYADPLGNKASFTYNSFSEPLTVRRRKGTRQRSPTMPTGILPRYRTLWGTRRSCLRHVSGDACFRDGCPEQYHEFFLRVIPTSAVTASHRPARQQ